MQSNREEVAVSSTWPRCWCGEADAFDPFGPTYVRCRRCGTLVSQQPAPESARGVRSDAEDFYGQAYATQHQVDLGLPSIEERRRDDMSDRCCYWLATLLRYRRPPARLLELGCSHGAASRLFAGAGFACVAIEMSQSVVRDAARIFDIDVRVGPVEEVPELGKFDVIASFDVIEHLPDPLRTMRSLREHLNDDGIVLIQTPCAPDASFESLLATGDPFLAHLQPAEHVYLFTRSSVASLMSEAGFVTVCHERPRFVYDMFFVTGAVGPRLEDDPQATLDSSGEARIVRALLDSYNARRTFEEAANARLEVIRTLQSACEERLSLIESLDREVQSLRRQL